jgi:hypothetical protein
LLALEIGELNALDFDLSLTGFDPFEIDDFLFPDDVDASADKSLDPPPVTAVSLPGDLWRCGKHCVLCGDATSQEAVAMLFGQSGPKPLLTDPPYGVQYQPGWREDAGLGAAATNGRCSE